MPTRRRGARSPAIMDGDVGDDPVAAARAAAAEKRRARAAAAAERIRSGRKSTSSKRSTPARSTSKRSSRKKSPSPEPKKKRSARSSSRGRRPRRNWVDPDSDDEVPGETFQEMEMEEEISTTSSSNGRTKGSKSRKRFAAEKRGSTEPRVTRMEQTNREWVSDNSEGEVEEQPRVSRSRRISRGRSGRAAIKDKKSRRRRSRTPVPIKDAEPSDEEEDEMSDIIDDIEGERGPNISSSDEEDSSDDEDGGSRPTTPNPMARSSARNKRASPAKKKASTSQSSSALCDVLTLLFYVFHIALSVVAYGVVAFAIGSYATAYLGVSDDLEAAIAPGRAWIADTTGTQSWLNKNNVGPEAFIGFAGAVLGFFMGLHGVRAMRRGD